jgi:cob(I)alamin adenosyltransferase
LSEDMLAGRGEPMRIYTKRGDDGTTGLLYGGRVSKAHPVAETTGALDEAVAAMGVARALAGTTEAGETLLRLQREMFVVGADVATNPEHRGKLTPRVSLVVPEMVTELESDIDLMVQRNPLPQEFIVPGGGVLSAALDVARAAVRRAERRVVELRESGWDPSPDVLRYLNRLSDLLFVMARSQAGDPESPSRAP